MTQRYVIFAYKTNFINTIYFFYIMKPKYLFKEKDHIYIGSKGKAISTSAFIKNYEEDFDSDMIAKRMVFKDLYPKIWADAMKASQSNPYKAIQLVEPQLTEEDWIGEYKFLIDKWALAGKVSSEEGTAQHKLYELKDIELGYKINPYTKRTYKLIPNNLIPPGYDNCSMADNLYDLEDGYYPEALIFNEDLNVCGLSDMLFIETIGDKRYIDIDDYKFVKEILKTPKFFDRILKKYPSMKEPISHIYQTNFYSYNMKISMYAWMLEQFGFIVRHLGLRHMVKLYNGEIYEVPYPMEYKKLEIELIIKDYKEKLQKT